MRESQVAESHVEQWIRDNRHVLVWTAYSHRCAIVGAVRNINGYVRLPPRLHLRFRDVEMEEIDHHLLSAPGGITYGMDAAGWIGFDTAHAGDVWEHHVLVAHCLDYKPGEATPLLLPWEVRWTLQMLYDAVRKLAKEVQGLP